MLRPIDDFFASKREPANSCLNALRTFILNFDPAITEAWRYGMPFYNYGAKRVCYIWIERKTGNPYLGIVHGNLLEHPSLVSENRAKMKILPLDPGEDLPMELIREILTMAIVAL